jgi:uncharacterized iron-regulated protein
MRPAAVSWTASSILLLLLQATGCSSSPGGTPTAAADTGKTFATAAEAPKYDGAAFRGMQIFDLEKGVYLDEPALLTALDASPLVFFGEQHETAPVQELELWLLTRMTDRHPDVSLAMEHFQHDEQPIVDAYIAGTIDTAEFEKTSQPWKTYTTYWKPLVEHMKALGRPVIALNVPDEALQTIYSAFPKTPLEVFNGWTSSFKYAGSVAPRPVGAWDATYKSYFESNFDYDAHGKSLGLSREDALTYFTDLAHIRDETMAYFLAQGLAAGGRVLTVAGDWHVQTGLATPDRAVRYAGTSPHVELLTTIPAARLAEVRDKTVSGRRVARFVFVYEAI